MRDSLDSVRDKHTEDTMTDTNNIQKTGHVLPPEVARAFDALAQAGDTETRNAYAAALRGAEWTLQSISEASGLTRERVRQIVKAESSNDSKPVELPLPLPPTKPVKAPRTYVEPDPDKLARLLELKPIAEMARAHTTGLPEVTEYNRLINEIVTVDKVPLYRLALRLGVTHSAVRGRLVRYGFKKSQGTSKAYTPIGSSSGQ